MEPGRDLFLKPKPVQKVAKQPNQGAGGQLARERGMLQPLQVQRKLLRTLPVKALQAKYDYLTSRSET